MLLATTGPTPKDWAKFWDPEKSGFKWDAGRLTRDRDGQEQGGETDGAVVEIFRLAPARGLGGDRRLAPSAGARVEWS
jgi:hypothetical protein